MADELLESSVSEDTLNLDVIIRTSDSMLAVILGEDTIYENDYLNLQHKPSINGIILEGNINETDPTIPEWAKAESKPVYTPDEIGATSISLEALSLLFNS